MNRNDDANVLGEPFRRFYGKYRGKVLENFDPLFLGRLLAEVAAVPAALDNWCMPCVPYAGFQVGTYNMPPIGANVWVEFEGGDPMRPIWAGCFWGEGEMPVEFTETPLMHLWKTEFITMQFDDTPEEGGIKIFCLPPAVATPLTMLFNSAGIEIYAPPAIITMITEEGITLTYPPGVIAMTEPAIEILIPPTSVTHTEEGIVTTTPTVEMAIEAEMSVEAGAAIAFEAGAAFEVLGADVAIEGAAIELTAAVVEITAVTNIVGVVSIEGAVAIEGGLVVDGMIPMLLP